MNDNSHQDVIYDSQPISLPSSNNSAIEQITSLEQKRPATFSGQKGNFRSIEEIDPKYRHLFTYPYFNLVQTHVIEDALYSDKSMVVCAPTGSGKTVIFEMAIVQLLMELEDKNYSGDFKIIYMAPVKALCTERLTEWYPKFNKLGHLCIEVTGDTDVEFPQLKPYRIIITTPEKWDMLTRRWKDHKNLVEVVKLFLIDEVHILNDEIRGPVLEAVVSRMKTIESSVKCTNRIEKLLAQYNGISTPPNTSAIKEINDVNPIRIRFVAISATVSNPQDVAEWLGTADKPAVYHKFGDECRPVKLKRIVEGYPCPVGTSIFKFDIILNYKLWNIIQKYHNGKPTLIFCNTRKSVALTAEALSREITVSFNMEQKNKLTALASTIKNKKIQSLILCGVGCHHAGLLFEERMNIENSFRNRDLPILITTTTLAMGVNLPAHLVIIKNTQQYVNGAYQEYSISTILQMVGRAGRPQYDTEATAVIMTRLQDKARYQSLVEGSEPLQSYLHKRLAENLNSETALGTVCDVAQCVQWLDSTFLSVRAARDPKRYLGLPHGAPPQQISKKIEELCVKAMNKLASAGLISMDEACCITSTEAGRLMSIYYLDLETMKLIMKLEGSESLERLLWLICESHELSDMHLRVDERRCLNSLNRNTAAATIRFPMKGKINSRQMKLNCVIQAVLGCLVIPEPSLNQEALKVMRIADRVCKCLVYYVTRPNFISQNPKFYLTILNSLVLAKCINARLWENSPYVSRQLKGIGQIFSTLLASAGKVNFMLLEESHPRDLERIMNKGPPAGNVIRRQVSLLPKYNLTATPIDEKTVKIQLSLLNHAHLSENIEQLTAGASHKTYIIVGDSENYLVSLTSFKDSDLINVYDGCMTFEVTRKHNSKHEILIHCISSTFVGIDEQCKYLFNDINPITTNKPVAISLPDTISNNLHDDEDIFKDRKRKSKEKDKSQCNEKKKRDINLIEKFNQLKESFGRTSKDIKPVDCLETKETSNKILNNLAPKPGDNVIDNKFDCVIEDSLDQNIEDAFAEDFNDEDFVDDKQVSDILNEIENEIKSKNEMSRTNNQIQSKPICSKNIFDRERNVHSIAKRKTFTTKNNYNFIDLLEKKDNNDEAINDNRRETGFTNAVKGQIDQYLQKAYNNNSKIDIIDLVEPTESNDKTKIHELNNDEDVYELIDLTETEKRSMNREEKIGDENNVDCANMVRYKGEIIQGNDTNTSQWSAIKPSAEGDLMIFDVKNNQNKKVIKEISLMLPDDDNITVEHNNLELYGDDLNISDEIQIHNPSTENKLALTTSYFNFQNIRSSKLSNTNENIVQSIQKIETTTKVLNSNSHITNKSNRDTNIDSARISGNNYEYIKNYHASQTKLINITRENNQKQKVQIVGKLKVDLDITEIVHKNEPQNIQNIDVHPDVIEFKSLENINDTNMNKNYYFGEETEAIAYKTQSNGNVFNDKNIKIEEKYIDTSKDNVSLKNLPNDIDFTNNFKSNINSSIQHEDKNIESVSVQDILQKYNNNVKRSFEEEISVNTQINKNIEGSRKFRKENGNKRKYRISDIDKIQIDLPPSLIGQSEKTTDSYYIDYKHQPVHGEIEEKDTDIEQMHDETQPEIVKNIPKINIEDLDSDLQYPDVVMELIDYNTDFDVNATMLNPKALLQSINNDDDENDIGEEDDEIIPPPPQFCDEDTYSPVYTSPENKLTDIAEYDLKSSQNVNEIDSTEDDFMFDESNEFDLTPSKEIETWSPSRDSSSVCPTEGQSFTVMRRNLAGTNNRHNLFNSRREKLSHFKFQRKSMFRK